MVQPLWRTVWRFLKKLRIEPPYDPAIPLLGIYPEKSIIQKESCTKMFIAALFTIAIKGKEIELCVVRWMDLESVIQSEVSQKEKNKYHMLTHIYGI